MVYWSRHTVIADWFLLAQPTSGAIGEEKLYAFNFPPIFSSIFKSEYFPILCLNQLPYFMFEVSSSVTVLVSFIFSIVFPLDSLKKWIRCCSCWTWACLAAIEALSNSVRPLTMSKFGQTWPSVQSFTIFSISWWFWSKREFDVKNMTKWIWCFSEVPIKSLFLRMFVMSASANPGVSKTLIGSDSSSPSSG